MIQGGDFVNVRTLRYLCTFPACSNTQLFCAHQWVMLALSSYPVVTGGFLIALLPSTAAGCNVLKSKSGVLDEHTFSFPNYFLCKKAWQYSQRLLKLAKVFSYLIVLPSSPVVPSKEPYKCLLALCRQSLTTAPSIWCRRLNQNGLFVSESSLNRRDFWSIGQVEMTGGHAVTLE